MTPPRRRLRVVHAVLDLEAGGLERIVAEMLTRLDPAEFECHLVSLNPPGRLARDLGDAVTIHQVPPLSRWSLLDPKPITRLLGQIGPQVVHTHSGVWYKVAVASRRAGIPALIHTDHGRPSDDTRMGRYLERLAAGRTNIVVAVSEPLATWLRRHVTPRGTDVRVCFNGVDSDRFAPGDPDGDLRRRLAIPAGAAIVGSVGRFDPIKGYDLMVRAFGILLAQLPDAETRPHLVIAGEGPELERLRDLVAQTPRPDQVHLLPWTPEIPTLLRTFDLFTLASRSEGTSISLLEAMSAARCPVVTDVGGNRDVLGADLAHRLVEPEQPAALAEAWQQALRDPVARARDGAVARTRVVERYSLARMVSRYADLYRELYSPPS